MTIEIDKTLLPQEQEEAFKKAIEHGRKRFFDMFYEKAIESGDSEEEATRSANVIANSIIF